jgi:1-acyl-sn-glycerol-3-phosphate acyltransferase
VRYLVYLALVYLYSSWAEWFAHKYILHSYRKRLPWAFEDHSEHHAAFPAGHFNEAVNSNKYKQLVLCLEHNLVFVLPVSVLGYFLDPALGLTMAIFGVLHFHWYNLVHTSMHLKHKIPLVPSWYFWVHFMHHQHPKKWYYVSLPGWDWIAGTTCKMTVKDKKDWRLFQEGYGIDIKDTSEDLLNLKDLDGCPLTKHQGNGHISQPNRRFGELLIHLLLPLDVIKVYGEYNLYNTYSGSYIFASSHGSWKDPMILRKVFRNSRVLTHRGVMSSMWGLVGLLLKHIGSVTVDKGERGIDSSVAILESGEDISICPEGWAWTDGRLRPFKTGAARIAKKSNCPIVPVYIKYPKYLPTWMTRINPPWIQYLLCLFLPPGAELYIGEPMFNLTNSVKDLTLELETRVRNLQLEANSTKTIL